MHQHKVMHSFPSEKLKIAKHLKKYIMHSKQRQIIDSHAFKHAFIQEQIIN